jgi:hypothetical protein
MKKMKKFGKCTIFDVDKNTIKDIVEVIRIMKENGFDKLPGWNEGRYSDFIITIETEGPDFNEGEILVQVAVDEIEPTQNKANPKQNINES